MLEFHLQKALLLLTLPLARRAIGCDCGGPVRNGVCNVPMPPDSCGDVCSMARPCPDGFYCGPASVCTADCSAEVACTGGYLCDDDGRCFRPADGGRDTSGRDIELVDNTCAAVELGTSRVTPNVLVVVDRSGSMRSEEFPPGSGTSRWDALRDALLARPDGLLFSLQSAVRFGLVTYENSDSPSGCPDLETIPCALDNFATIDMRYSRMDPGSDTPTGDSITAVLSMLSTLVPTADAGDPTIIVLATDGEPDTCEDGSDTTGGRLESVAATEAAYMRGVSTYVISVGTDVGADHLQDVANAGLGRSGSDPDAMYWVASDTVGLNDALESIIGGVVGDCRLTLSGEIDPSLACSGQVILNGTELPCDDANGWRAVDASHIELQGTACDELMMPGATLVARFPCDVVVF